MKFLKFIGKIVISVIIATFLMGFPFLIGFGLVLEGKIKTTAWLWGLSILAAALGFTLGIKLFESKSKEKSSTFLSICKWTFTGVIGGYAVGRIITPLLPSCINFIFAFGIISIIAREIAISRKEKSRIKG